MSWICSRWASVVCGLVVGAAVGLVVYRGSQLSGQSAFILCGTTVGGVAAAIIHSYTRVLQLTEVTVSVPQFSELRFAVTRDNQQVAWRLFVEAVTRVSVRPLEAGTGQLREAFNSLYTLFATTREVLAQAQPSRAVSNKPTVEHLAIAMLSDELRPFLSTWHPRLRSWEQGNSAEPEGRWPYDAECRDELAAMQRRLAQYVVGFGELAQVPNLDAVMRGNLWPHSADSTGRRAP